jgi:hypothetical protein
MRLNRTDAPACRSCCSRGGYYYFCCLLLLLLIRLRPGSGLVSGVAKLSCLLPRLVYCEASRLVVADNFGVGWVSRCPDGSLGTQLLAGLPRVVSARDKRLVVPYQLIRRLLWRYRQVHLVADVLEVGGIPGLLLPLGQLLKFHQCLLPSRLSSVHPGLGFGFAVVWNPVEGVLSKSQHYPEKEAR